MFMGETGKALHICSVKKALLEGMVHQQKTRDK